MNGLHKLDEKLSGKRWYTILRGFRLFHNIKLKIISLGLAMLLWLVVVSIDNPVMTLPFSPISVNVVNADVMESDGKAFEIADSSKTIGINVKAARSVLSLLSRDNFVATIDMSNLDGNRVPIEVKSTKYADKIESITPRQRYATVIVENLKSQQFKIQVVPTGETPEGYAIGSSSVTTNVVKVSGPESVVSTIDRAEVHVNVSNMTSEIHSNERIILYDKNGSTVDASTLMLSIDSTNVTVEIWKTKEIEINASYEGSAANGYAVRGMSMSKTSAVIAGKDSDLESISVVDIPSSAVNIDGATQNVSKEIDIRKYLPVGVILVDGESTVNIKVRVEQLKSTVLQIPAANIAFANVPEGITAAAANPEESLQLGVVGLSDTLSKINASSLQGIVDIDTIKAAAGTDTLIAGSYEAKVSFSLPSGVTQANEVKISIILHGQEAAGNNTEQEHAEDAQNDAENEAESPEENSENEEEANSGEEENIPQDSESDDQE